ncbi:MAG: choice-of-anchor R domain-containing protein [Isosphaeraceae bacterium]
MFDPNARRCAGVLLTMLALSIIRPPSAGASTVVLSDNITGVATGGLEAATGSIWLASSFSTGGASDTLDSVTLLLENPVAGNATVSIYTDGGLQPGTLVGTLTSPSSYLGPLVETRFTADGITLSADTTYWVVLQAAGGEFDWAWASSDSGTGVGFTDTWASSTDAGNSWFAFVGPDSYPLQMIVSATVPEPGSMTLLGLGAGLVLLHRRFRGRRTGFLPAATESSSARRAIPRPISTEGSASTPLS